MLSKPPFPSYSQFVTAVQSYDLRVQSMNFAPPQIDINMAFYANRPTGGRGRGRGRGNSSNGFNSKGRGFVPTSQNSGFNISNCPSAFTPSNSNGQQSASSNPTYRAFGHNQQPNRGQNSTTYIPKNSAPVTQNSTAAPIWFTNTRAPLICQICDRRGYFAAKCWYRWDYAYQAHDDIPQVLAAEDVDPTLYMDTGASAHITNDPGNLTNLVPYAGSDKITVGDGSCLNISHIGDCVQYRNIKLNDVLVVPKMKKNLVSVSQLAKDNACTCEFTDSNFVIKDKATGTILASGHKHGNLYALNKAAEIALSTVRSGKAAEDIWHQRLGHLNSRFLKILNSQHVIDVNKWKKIPTLCSSCQLGKSCKLSFPSRNKIETEPLAKIHSDLWGPTPVSSFQGMKYYVVFVDDFSRFSWLYPLKMKSEFFTTFLKFQNLVENSNLPK